LRKLVKAGILLVLDECHAGKNNSDQTYAIGALMNCIVEMCEQDKECRSRVLMLSGTHFERDSKAINVVKSMGLLGYDVKDAQWALTRSRLVKLVKRLHPGEQIATVSKRADLDREIYRLFTKVVSQDLVSSLPSPVIDVNLDAKLGFYHMGDAHSEELLKDAVDKMEQALLKIRQSRGSGTQGEMIQGRADLMKAIQIAHESKVQLAIRLMTQELESDPSRQCILFGLYHDSLNEIAQGLARFGVGMLTGKQKKRGERIAVQKAFHASEIRVLIANVVVGGSGLNLQDYTGHRARSVFILPSYITDAVYQASFRAYRLGAKSDVKVRFLFSTKYRENCILDNWGKKTSVWTDLMPRQKAEGQSFLADLGRVEEVIPGVEVLSM
jgi:hypothetical protein